MEFTDQILDNKCHIILILLTGNSITSAKVYNHIHFQDRSDNFYNNQFELFTNGNKMFPNDSNQDLEICVQFDYFCFT